MSGIRSSGPTPRRWRQPVAPILPAVLAIVAEGAWIAVVAGLVDEFALSFPVLSLPVFVVGVAGGAVTASVLARRSGARWPAVAATLTIALAAAGWVAAPQTRDAIARSDVLAALGSHPGGWLLGLAFLRGFGYAHLPVADGRLGRLLGVGVAWFAVAAIAGGMISEPWRGRFLADALDATIVFVACATLAAALARLAAIGTDGGFDWRRNPAWTSLLLGLVLVTAALALPMSRAAGPLVTLVVGVAIGPLVVIAFVAGFTRRTASILAIAALVSTGFVALIQLFATRSAPGSIVGGSGPTGTADPPTPATETIVASAVVALVIATLVAYLLVRFWSARRPVDDGLVTETRTIDRGDGSAGVAPRRTRRRRGTPPTDAVAAYRAALAELETIPVLQRASSETPAEHARRARRISGTGLALDLLAADYALARYGDVELSRAEHERAVGRWRSLRNVARAGR
jgi:hypothetical protein